MRSVPARRRGCSPAAGRRATTSRAKACSWPGGTPISRAHAVGVPLHSDAVQAVGQVPVDFAGSGVDALTMTGHKLGGPMGAGALLLRREAECTPLLHGGGQERDVRSGTLDVAAIVVLAVATVAAAGSREERAGRLSELRGRLVTGVV